MNKLSLKVLNQIILLLLISSILTIGWVIYNSPSVTHQDYVVIEEDLTLNNFITTSIAEIKKKLGTTEYQTYDIDLSIHDKRSTHVLEVNITYVEIDEVFGVDVSIKNPNTIPDEIKKVIEYFFSEDVTITEMGHLRDDHRYKVYSGKLVWSFFDGYPEGEAGEGMFLLGDPFMSNFLMYSGNPGLDFIEFSRR